MEYAIARELSERGFPEGMGGWIYPGDKLVARYSDRVYVPTLTELIDAVQERGPWSELLIAFQAGSWSARVSDNLMRQGSGSGRSADEAVARLWLSLEPFVGYPR